MQALLENTKMCLIIPFHPLLQERKTNEKEKPQAQVLNLTS
jgi:hypothetical protein